MTRRHGDPITDGFKVRDFANEITFNRFSDVQQERSSLFWQLPAKFRGNQVASYGGYLTFTMTFSVAQDAGELYRDVDIELVVSSDLSTLKLLSLHCCDLLTLARGFGVRNVWFQCLFFCTMPPPHSSMTFTDCVKVKHS